MSIAGLFLVAGQLLHPAIIDDARRVPHLVDALDRSVGELTLSQKGAARRELEDRIVANLVALERLDPESALAWARRLVKGPIGLRVSVAARRVAARMGDDEVVRRALADYDRDPGSSRRILGDAAAANDDIRLRDFRAFAVLPDPPNDDVLRTMLLRLLGDEIPPSPPPELVGDDVRDPSRASPGGADAADAADAFAAMYRFHELHPQSLLQWLDADDDELRERAQFVLALSVQRSRLPLLIELAVDGPDPGRDAAFRALAEMDLGDFDQRLHRLAGDPDAAVRFQTALALVPSGDEWALRLLFAELDEASRIERKRARRALERVDSADVIALLETLVSDTTATPFAIELYLELTEGRRRGVTREALWALLAPHVVAEAPSALRAAARLHHPEARAAVRRYLERR